MIKSKQRSEPLKILPPQSKNKGKRELSPIGKELLNHCNARQPVFLYGKGNIDRKDLIRDVHKANGGIDADGEYFDDDGKLTTREKLKDEFKRIYKSKSSKKKNKLDIPLSPMSYDLKELGFLDRHFLSTPRTGNYVDCGTMMTAKEIYIELVIDAGIISEAKSDGASKMLLDKYMSMDIGRINEQELKSLRNKNSLSALYDMFNGKTIEVEPVYKGYLFQCKGNLFIDNLPKPTSSEDEKYYRLLAKIIKDREFGYPFTTFNWLVVYTYDDLKYFDKYFLEPFEPISLGTTEPRTEVGQQEGEVEEAIAIDRVRLLLKYKGKKAKVEPKQIELFELLWKNKDKIVKRNEIDKELWPETENKEPISPIQIEQQVNSLRDGLEKLGFKREIIKTYKKTQLEKGAYEFHSDLSSFLK